MFFPRDNGNDEDDAASLATSLTDETSGNPDHKPLQLKVSLDLMLF